MLDAIGLLTSYILLVHKGTVSWGWKWLEICCVIKTSSWSGKNSMLCVLSPGPYGTTYCSSVWLSFFLQVCVTVNKNWHNWVSRLVMLQNSHNLCDDLRFVFVYQLVIWITASGVVIVPFELMCMLCLNADTLLSSSVSVIATCLTKEFWYLSSFYPCSATKILLLLIRGSNRGTTLIITRRAKKKDKS
jgi:hypothetical protein